MTKSFYEVQHEIDMMVEDFVQDNCEQYPAEQLGLDRRCGKILVVPNEGILVVTGSYNQRMLDYYGGFEYVDSEYKSNFGNYTLYSIEDDRVAGHMERIEEDVE